MKILDQRICRPCILAGEILPSKSFSRYIFDSMFSNTTQVADFISFEDRLDNSLQRDIIKIEHLKMRLAHEPINTDIVDMELIELKFIFDRCAPQFIHSPFLSL